MKKFSYRRSLAMAALVAMGCLGLTACSGKKDIERCQAAYVAKRYTEAFKCLEPLAKEGNAPAQFNLGVMYRDGQGVPQDDAQAAAWFRKAAEQGDAVAKQALERLSADK